MFRTTALTAMLLLLAASAGISDRAQARGGEDFPFFCMTDNEPNLDSFKIVSDLRSSTGYALELYRNGGLDGYVEANVDDSTDGKYWVVYARQWRWTVLFDRQVLAYINKDTGESPYEDVKASLHNAAGRDWELKPMRCGTGLN